MHLQVAWYAFAGGLICVYGWLGVHFRVVWDPTTAQAALMSEILPKEHPHSCCAVLRNKTTETLELTFLPTVSYMKSRVY